MRSYMYQNAPFCKPKLAYGKSVLQACGFSSIKIDYSDHPKKLISRILNEFYVFSI